MTGRAAHPLAWLYLALFTCLFVKNAWVDEDAYITFRSIEQLFAGHGLRWNPHERVQAFTHPLWLAALSPLRVFTRDLFAAAILASYALCLTASLAVTKLLAVGQAPAGDGAPAAQDIRAGWAMVLLGVIASKSFFDFTSSGLENPLAYALLAFFLLGYVRSLSCEGTPRAIRNLSLLFSLLLLTRHDLLLLAGPMYAAAIWRARALGIRRILPPLLLGALPFLAWTLFSILYYGFPLPNTAYAKLGTAIPADTLWIQGLHYLQSLARNDPLTLAVITAAAGGSIVQRRPGSASIGLGLAAYMIYVTRIGGDYMAGRFFAAPYWVATLYLVYRYGAPRRALLAVGAVVVVYAIALPGSPLLTGADFEVDKPDRYGIGDQRGLLFPISSIHRWIARDPEQPFPDYKWSREGRALARSPERVVVRANIGFMGYHAGTDEIIIDRLALADPLLARLPAQPLWRVGHYPRRLPAGYLESVRTAQEHIEDPGIRAFHQKLRILTEAELWSLERLRVILMMNIGRYGGLLEPAG